MRRPGDLRRQFPVLEELAYLNAGTCGPLPAPSLRAGADEALAAAEHGRTGAYFARPQALAEALRGRYARVLGAQPQDVALTLSTSDGLVRVLTGLRLQPGDEVLTSTAEHPGLLGPLAQAQRLLGIRVRTAPLADLPDAVSADTKLVACSHVSWVDGTIAPAALGALDVPVLLDGAQGAGAIDVDVAALGCAAYAASGQKWLCGPIGTGMLWIAPDWRERLPPLSPVYANLAEPSAGLDAAAWDDARAYDAGAFSAQTLAAAEAAAGVLEDAGWPDVIERAASLAETLVAMLREAGRSVAPRARTTLVAWEDYDPASAVMRLAEAGVAVRALPGTSYVRASVGAWNDESDLERLVGAL